MVCSSAQPWRKTAAKIEVNKKSLLNLFLFMVSTFFRLSGYGLTLIRILVFWEAVNRVRMWWRGRKGLHKEKRKRAIVVLADAAKCLRSRVLFLMLFLDLII